MWALGFLFLVLFFLLCRESEFMDSECSLLDGWIWNVRGGLVIVEGGEECVVVGRIVS